MTKTALITGITGQDGSYLAEFLISKGYEVHGIRRRSSSFNTARIDHIYGDEHFQKRIKLHYADLTDANSLSSLVYSLKPNELYNLGAQSHVAVSFVQPVYTLDVNTLGVARLLEAVKQVTSDNECRFYQASTSEMFGASEPPQSETTPFIPQSPYAVSKLAAHELVKNYRDSYDMYAVNGILFNHESPRRGENFVTRKITLGLARIKLGLQKNLFLGNIDAVRDWGHAREYVELQWLMLQQKQPQDFVIGTGRSETVRDFCLLAGKALGFDLIFEGHGIEERGIDRKTNKVIIQIDPMYYRPAEVENLRANISTANVELGWQPSVTLEDLVQEMAEADLLIAKKELSASRVVK
jgi:GDPmannose 4,6-dehydratase